MESAKRNLGNLNFALHTDYLIKKHLNITQKSVKTTNERTIISENKYFLSRTFGVKFGLVLFTFCSLPSLTRAAVPYPSKAKFGFMTII